MNKKILMKLLIFNAVLIIINVILFSPGLVGLTFASINSLVVALSTTVIVTSVLLFGVGNYKILTSKIAQYGYVLEELKEGKDYQDALEYYYDKDKELKLEIKRGITQIKQIDEKQEILLKILQQNHKEHFTAVIQTGQDAKRLLYDNITKVLNRIMIITPSKNLKDEDAMQDHKLYITNILNKNEIILDEYDKMLIEVSKIGENDKFYDASILTDMTKILKEQRTDNLNSGEE